MQVPRKKSAITLAELEALVATCDVSLEGPRDRALLYFGFASGGRRRSEIAAAELADLRPLPERGFFIYRLEYNKTQQDSPSATLSCLVGKERLINCSLTRPSAEGISMAYLPPFPLSCQPALPTKNGPDPVYHQVVSSSICAARLIPPEIRRIRTFFPVSAFMARRFQCCCQR